MFGVSVCTISGQRHNIGDTDTMFCVQSCSKPITYCLGQQEMNPDKVHQHVGYEPSGRPFNEVCLDTRAAEEDEAKLQHKLDYIRNDATLNAEQIENKCVELSRNFKTRPKIPHNPMINAGAIMACALVDATNQCTMAERFEKVESLWNRLSGGTGKIVFDNATYLSESATADRNFCLGYLMHEAGAFPEGTNLADVLEFYFMCCSIKCTAEMMATIAATLANGGTNPLTGENIFDERVVANTLSLMNSCGMYDASGEFAFKMGFPAKSGVGGGIMTVIPGVMGICTFSPRLNEYGNSTRGMLFLEKLSNVYAFHIYGYRS